MTDNLSFQIENIEKERLRKRIEENLFQSENRYRSLTEMAPVGIFHADKNGNTTYVNHKWSEITGISFTDAMGTKWIKAIHPQDKEMKRWMRRKGG